jgi:hypothetical protein
MGASWLNTNYSNSNLQEMSSLQMVLLIYQEQFNKELQDEALCDFEHWHLQ